MIHPNIDENRLAAFLEGSLDARERAQMVEELSSSEEGAALLADIMPVLLELEAEGLAPAPVLPLENDGEEEGEDEREIDPPRAAAPDAAGSEAKVIRLPLAPAEAPRDAEPPASAPESAARDDKVTPIETRRRAPAARWVAWAAVAAGVALVPLLWSRFGGAAADDPLRAVAMVEGAPLPAEWNSQPWSTTRGEDDASADPAAAVRIGALLVDLEVAHAAGDTSGAALQATRVVSVLDGVPATGPLSSHYRAVAEQLSRQDTEPVDRLLEEGWQYATEFLGEEMVRLGAWIEAGRLAAARGDAEFFRDRGARGVLERAAGDPALSAPARAAAGRALAAMRAEGAPDWDALRSGLDELLKEAAS